MIQLVEIYTAGYLRRSKMKGAYLITRHAVERFIKRHAPEMTVDAAREHLITAASRASRLREKTLLGQEQWQIDDPPCVLVMRPDRYDRRLMICLTVLPEPEPCDQDPSLLQALMHKRRRDRW